MRKAEARPAAQAAAWTSPWLHAAVLVALVWVVYWPVGAHPFVAFDDPAYVYENELVRRGLTAEGLRWALTSWSVANWHPLTWLSHMLDVQLFGVDPGWMHRVNVAWHCANAVLLLVFLRRTTGRTWRSLAVAALFALHPLRVESVAWIAERKDVLSTFFWLAAMVAYAGYARRSALRSYLAVVALFVLGLASKPMVVTLPAVLLLLDVWPLSRVAPGRPLVAAAWPLVREKLPLFAVSLASAAVTYLAQRTSGAVRSLQGLPLPTRCGNAIVSAVTYLWQAIWPVDLAVFYPHPGYTPAGIPTWQVALSAALLVAITTAAVATWRRRPYLLAGWGWYLVTLAPVIGIVQVGRQAHADRYTYVPLIGVSFAVVWAVADAVERRRAARATAAATAAALALAAAVLARAQVDTWHDGLTLFSHAARVTRDNATAWKNVGSELFQRGDHPGALAAFVEAARFDPEDPALWFDQGMALYGLGRLREATAAFEQSLRLDPDDRDAWFTLGVTWGLLHEPERAAWVGRRLRALDSSRADELDGRLVEIARAAPGQRGGGPSASRSKSNPNASTPP